LERTGGGDIDSIMKSPSEYSSRSYEMWVGGDRTGDDATKEKMSIRSEYGDSADSHAKLNGRIRKVITFINLTLLCEKLESCLRFCHKVFSFGAIII